MHHSAVCVNVAGLGLEVSAVSAPLGLLCGDTPLDLRVHVA
jgi:hypothetical protein